MVQRGVHRTSRTVFVRCSYGVAYGVAYGVRSVCRAAYVTYGATHGPTYGTGAFGVSKSIILTHACFEPAHWAGSRQKLYMAPSAKAPCSLWRMASPQKFDAKFYISYKINSLRYCCMAGRPWATSAPAEKTIPRLKIRTRLILGSSSIKIDHGVDCVWIARREALQRHYQLALRNQRHRLETSTRDHQTC